jgi:cob(I)alamin adenosyltransferase
MIHVYTGTGKGKTTAALGLALRAAGAGMNVYIAQFLKSGPGNELKALKKINRIKVEHFGRECLLKSKISKSDILLANKGLDAVEKKIRSKKFDLIILDEVNIALYYKLLNLEDALKLCKMSKGIELVFTGRYAPKEILKRADLVSEIREVKHYFRKGIKARKGIEF